MNRILDRKNRTAAAATLLAALLALPGAAALHEPPLRVSLSGPSVETAPLVPYVAHTLDEVRRQATSPLAAQAEAPAVLEPPGGATPDPETQAEAPAAPQAAPDPLPWILAGLAGLALLALVLGAWLLGRRATRRNEAARDLEEKLALSRLCAGSSIRRAARLARVNVALREELAAARASAAAPAAGPQSANPA